MRQEKLGKFILVLGGEHGVTSEEAVAYMRAASLRPALKNDLDAAKPVIVHRGLAVVALGTRRPCEDTRLGDRVDACTKDGGPMILPWAGWVGRGWSPETGFLAVRDPHAR